MRIKVTALDKKTTKAVFLRDNYTCQRCLKMFPEDGKIRGASLHNAHIMPRRHKNTRFLLQNCISLCFKCHQWFDSHRFESTEWITNKLGEDVIQWLRVQSNQKWNNDTKLWSIYLDEKILEYKNKEV